MGFLTASSSFSLLLPPPEPGKQGRRTRSLLRNAAGRSRQNPSKQFKWSQMYSMFAYFLWKTSEHGGCGLVNSFSKLFQSSLFHNKTIQNPFWDYALHSATSLLVLDSDNGSSQLGKDRQAGGQPKYCFHLISRDSWAPSRTRGRKPLKPQMSVSEDMLFYFNHSFLPPVCYGKKIC